MLRMLVKALTRPLLGDVQCFHNNGALAKKKLLDLQLTL
jgi:hypothetical protein